MLASPGSTPAQPPFLAPSPVSESLDETPEPLSLTPAPDSLDGPSLALLRTIAGLSRRKAAILVGSSVNVYCLYERGKVRIPQERIPTILSVLVPLADAHSQAYAALRQTLSLPVDNKGGQR